MVAPLEVEEITELAGLERLRPDWETLWRSAPGATPFQHPGWQLAWWRAFHPGRLLTLAVRRRGALVAVWPLYLEEGERHRLLPVGIAVSDYLDATVAADEAESATEAAAAHLARRRDVWDTAELHDLPPGASLLRMPAHELASEVLDGSIVRVLPLGGRPLGELVPRSMRQNLAYYRRRAERAGISSTLLAADRGEEGLGIVAALHERRWAARGEAGVFADEPTRAFHREAALALAREGLLRLHLVAAGAVPIAAIYGFHAKGRAYLYITGLDPAYEPVSPGTLAIAAAIETAQREGCREFDLLRGDERYKLLWGAVPLRNAVRVLRHA